MKAPLSITLVALLVALAAQADPLAETGHPLCIQRAHPQFGSRVGVTSDRDGDGKTDWLVADRGCGLEWIVSSGTRRSLERRTWTDPKPGVWTSASELGETGASAVVLALVGVPHHDIEDVIVVGSLALVLARDGKAGTRQLVAVAQPGSRITWLRPLREGHAAWRPKVHAAPDQDLDGSGDVLVVLPGTAIELLNARTGEVTRRWEHADLSGMWALDAALIAAPKGGCTLFASGTFGIGEGEIRAFDLATQKQTWERAGCSFADDVWHLAESFAVGPDMDRDGTPDLILGVNHSRSFRRGRAFLVSGATGRTLDELVRDGDEVRPR